MNPESLPQVKPGDTVKADHHNSLVKAVRRRTPVSSPTIKIVETSSGFYCEIVRNGASTGATQTRHPFYVSSTGAVTPGTVNGSMVTLSEEPLDNTSNVINMEINGPIWLAITFTLTWTSTSPAYLASAVFSSARIGHNDGLPSNTTSVKYYQIGNVSGGIATMTIRDNVTAFLLDNGPDATALATIAAP
jgi:hypothetical protein